MQIILGKFMYHLILEKKIWSSHVQNSTQSLNLFKVEVSFLLCVFIIQHAQNTNMLLVNQCCVVLTILSNRCICQSLYACIACIWPWMACRLAWIGCTLPWIGCTLRWIPCMLPWFAGMSWVASILPYDWMKCLWLRTYANILQ